MQFSRLCLLSTREESAFEINFQKPVTVLRGLNGTGKSAVMKALYQVLGAKPHKIDQSWKSAAVSILLKFNVDQHPYVAFHTGERYSLYDDLSGELIADTTSVSRTLGPAISELLEFGLLMTDRDENLVVPPPAYAFAPFYVDQDRGWARPWDSFDGMYLPNSKRTLSNYHSGLRTNEYYFALAARERQVHAIRDLETERLPLARAIEEIAKLTTNLAIDLNIHSFEDETNELARRSAILNSQQSAYRTKLNRLSSEIAIWSEQKDILRLALREMDQTISLASEQASQVDCPTCGQTYDNTIASRFGIISEYDDIFDALQTGDSRIRELSDQISELSGTLASIDLQIEQIDEILSVEKGELSLGDIISAQGRNETTALLREKVSNIDELIDQSQAKLNRAIIELRKSTDLDRTRRIRDYFDRRRLSFSDELDVRVQSSRDAIAAPRLARGSEGTRELLSYYYAVLFCAAEFSSSAFCPIVIDAPNQQGQDSQHLQAVYEFLIDSRPPNSQLIFSAEEPKIVASAEVDIIEVSGIKHQVLVRDLYQRIFEEMKPYLGYLL